MIYLITETRESQDLYGFVRSLLFADWESPGGPLHLNGNLSLADLAESDFFFNARLFLAVLAENNGAPTTVTGNLNRVFVGHMFKRLKLSPLHRESTLRYCKVVNEQDVRPLHLARVVSELARLVARRKKRFHLTKAGRALLPDDQAGALYRALFLSYFRRFDLRYDFQLRDVPGIQETMAAILWRLDTAARDWVSVRGLAPKILLPAVLAEMREAMVSEYDTEEWILSGYVLDPLLAFGLIETKKKDDEWPSVTKKDAIRVTALWQKFIRFAWKGEVQ